MSLTPYEWYNKQMVDKLKRERMTAVDWFVKTITDKHDKSFMEFYGAEIQEANAMFKEQTKDAVMYGLDEDGHTGDWKISVAENYYKKTYTEM